MNFICLFLKGLLAEKIVHRFKITFVFFLKGKLGYQWVLFCLIKIPDEILCGRKLSCLKISIDYWTPTSSLHGNRATSYNVVCIFYWMFVNWFIKCRNFQPYGIENKEVLLSTAATSQITFGIEITGVKTI